MGKLFMFEGPCRLVNPVQTENKKWYEQTKGGVYLWVVKTDLGYRPIYVGISQKDMAFRTWEHLRAYMCGDYSILDSRILKDSSKKLEDAEIRRARGYPWEKRASDISTGQMSKIQDGLPEFLELVEIFFCPAQGEDFKELMKLESGIINFFGKEHLENSRRSTAEEFSEAVEITFADNSLKSFHVGKGHRFKDGQIPMIFNQ